MKLYIKESDFIIEDIAAVKKYYPNISDDTFMQLIELDPTYKGNDSVGKYGKWLLNLYNKGKLSNSEFKDIPDLLNQFTIYRNRIQNKDLNSYKSLQDLSDILATVVDDDSMLTDRQKVRFLKNVKAGRVKTSAEDDYDIVLDTPKFVVYVPNTHEASMKLGKGTDWCTAHENPQWYDSYTKDGGKLYIIKNKETSERWQYSDRTKAFLDEYDEKFNIMELMLQDEKLSKFFAKFLGIDYFNFDGNWVYDGKEIPRHIKPAVKSIIISDGVTKIGNCAFIDCKLLTSITIPNSVTKIGIVAFGNCKSLTSITIPDSVTEIGDRAFGNCKLLTSITIPNSVTKIGNGAFEDCKSLTSITIPDSVTEIGDRAFENCKSLTSITIPNSVTKIGIVAFGNCESLTSITIPNSVRKIENRVFDNCPNLTVYTNNNYVKEYCLRREILTKPLTNNESYRKPFKLHIRED